MVDRIMPSAPAQRGVIGHGPGQPALGARAGSRSLGGGAAVLPELAEAPARERRWWKHPAFIVSMILTVLALGAALAWWIVSMVTDTSVRVDGLSISIEGGNVHLDWSGPDAEYALFAVAADGTATDLTQLVVASTEAWVPSAAGLYDDATCFVVRPAQVSGAVTLDAATLQSQGGAGTCVADAGA
ncbi:hypothetical protein FLP10_12400 [Agromyces intestinalis]|uniref:Uncharacterized protein n=1 Tax=Agromyces intestinalis TaxID=2592652 RepID=A0A5C1YGI5_9MICO|nr:hypothetical protein [Agromyces intestinalis]QEO15123.1 hypothetical protein FLP10_12400 [Agromyces intestinalis]